MNNVFFIVGRISDIIEVNSNQVELLVDVDYKPNQNQEVIEQKVKVDVWNGIASKVIEYCAPKDIIGLKGHTYMDEDNHNILVADKVSFLSSRNDKIEN